MKVGDHAEVTRIYSAADMAEFAALAGGALPGHVPEPLIGALFSYLLGVKLPGFGTNYLKQSLQFHGAAPLDTPLTARVEITRLRPEKHLVDLATTVRLPDGGLCCDGRALVLARDVGA
ncbi:MAG: phosphate acetyltransferase [Rhodobacter sp.]|nr:phosphate acetyltransferase [Paracoccaceae bacterium]MCC0077514.1 phosphate acetyltransferase [Rhodobacter sp.]